MSTFSIIIPTLNEEHYVPLLLSDIEHQITKDFEVIVVDAHSTDKTKEKVLKFAKKFPIQFVLSDKKNVSFQRNLGAQKAKGEYLVFIDADTRIPKNFLLELYKSSFLKHFQLVLPSISWEKSDQKVKIFQSFVKSLIRASHFYGKPLATGGNLIVARSVFEKLNGFNEEILLSEDHDFVRKAYDLGIKAKIPKNLKVTISLRRSNAEGDMSLIFKYILAFLVYTVSPNERLLKRKMFDYEMGGHHYLVDELKKKQQSQKHAQYLKHFLQLSSVLLAMRYFTRI